MKSSSPQNDSNGGTGTGPGTVDPKKFKQVAQSWGTLPPKEREKAMVELTKDLPARQPSFYHRLSAAGRHRHPSPP